MKTLRQLEARNETLEDARNWLVGLLGTMTLTLLAKYPNSSPELIDSLIMIPAFVACFSGIALSHREIDKIRDEIANILGPRQRTFEY